MREYVATLGKCPLFQGIAPEELADLLSCLQPAVRTFTEREAVALEGEPGAKVGIVLRGEIAVVRENAAGVRVILTVLGPGGIFGEMGAFAGNGAWPATVLTQRESLVLFIEPHVFLGNCGKSGGGHRALTGNMLRILAQKALLLQRKVEYLSQKTLRGKIGTYLLEQHARSKGGRFLLSLNRRDLADFLNVARPSLSRELCRMRDEGIIDFHRNAVAVKDLSALRRAALS